ncbi:transporter substrate-binding domain-containing protein, partial [Candidatus Thioglobus sp.]|nr:transporter substrate-binding domain-containing protein [Candidatus Thioglobus sp.]
MSIKLGFTKSSIALAVALLSLNMTVQAGAVYDYIKSNNELMIATDANWAPYSYINDAGEMEGFDVDVGREIAKRMGVEARFITPSWDIIT